jgi:uncharacterized protein (DUF2141 family)
MVAIGLAKSALAIPDYGSPAIQPAAGYAAIVPNGDPANPLDITVTATKRGFGVFWVAIYPPAGARYGLYPAANNVGWATQPNGAVAVWRTNTGVWGNMLTPPGTSGYRGNPYMGRFRAGGSSNSARYVIHVINLNTGETFWAYPNVLSSPGKPPVARDDCANNVTYANTPIQINVLANDSDPDGHALTVIDVSDPRHGTAVVAPDGQSVVYLPDTNYTGSDSFTYTISNGQCGVISTASAGQAAVFNVAAGKNCTTQTTGCTDSASVCITVKPKPVAPPVARDDCSNNVTSVGKSITIDVLANDADPYGYPLTVIAVTRPTHGTAVISADGKSVVYTPASGYSGPDYFGYTISNGQCGATIKTLSLNAGKNCTTPAICTASAKVCVTVKPSGPPVARDDCGANVTAADTPITINVLTNDSDPNGYPLTVISVTRPAHGAAVISAGGKSIVYTPASGYSGSDDFAYTISNGQCGPVGNALSLNAGKNCTTPTSCTATAKVCITVTPKNKPPVPKAQCYDVTVQAGSSVNVPISALEANFTDPDGGTVTFQAVGAPTCGTAVVSGRSVVYTPGTSCGSSASIPYTVTDNKGAAASADICITITPQPGKLCGKVTCVDDSSIAMAGVIVTLTAPGGAVTTTTTDSTGSYCFENLKPGNYTVSVPGTANGKAVSGTGSASVSLIPGGSPTQDFTYSGGSISGLVYKDASGNCTHDANAVNLQGVTITLTRPDGSTVTTLTKGDGSYSFSGCDIVDGSYTIAAPGTILTYTLNSAASLAITLTPGGSSPNNNFCYKDKPGKLCGKVTCVDDSSIAMAGVIVTLTAPGGAVTTTTTDSTGSYCFENLKPGNYTVSVPGTANGKAVSGTGSASVTIVAEGSATQDFTYVGGSISGFVFKDTSGDCSHDNSPINLQGVTITLTKPDTSTVTTITNQDGFYSFSGCDIVDGKYTVTAPNFVLTYALNSAASLAITLTPGGSSPNNNFCYKDKPGKLCGKVTCVDTGSTAMAGVIVTLTAPGGAVTTTTTGDDGSYCFENLKPGAYTVSVPGSSNGKAVTGTGSAGVTIVAEGSATQDFTYVGGAISGLVYKDASGNCTHDANAVNLQGITITLTKPDGSTVTTLTKGDGSYSFSGCDIVDGSYTIAAPGTILTYTLNSAASLAITLTPGGSSPNNNFCYKDKADCNILIFGPDQAVYSNLMNALTGAGVPDSSITWVNTPISVDNPNPLTKALMAKQYCTIYFDAEFIGPDRMEWGGLTALDQQTLKQALLSGTGLVYGEPYNFTTDIAHPENGPYPKGQMPDVLPILCYFMNDGGLSYTALDQTSPLTTGVTDPFNASTGGQNNIINMDYWPAPVAYDSLKVVGISTTTTGWLSKTVGPTIWTLNYGGPNGGRVAIIGTDPYFPHVNNPTADNPNANDILRLYVNAVKYTAHLIP